MTTPVHFADADAARYFCRAVAPRGFMAGSAMWSAEKLIREADRFAAAIVARPARSWDEPGVRRVARICASYRKGRGVRFDAVPCQRCGALLTNPESIAAGVGPECQEKTR